MFNKAQFTNVSTHQKTVNVFLFYVILIYLFFGVKGVYSQFAIYTYK